MWLKRLVRPLIPDRLMARYRLHQHSRQVRTNVDMLVATEREQKRWLAATPDTYRVGVSPSLAGAPDSDLVRFGPADESEAAALAAGATGAAVGVVATTTPPRLLGRRRAEPVIVPRALAVRNEALAEVGHEAADLVGLHRRLRDAGNRVALVPRAGEVVGERRTAAIVPTPVLMLAAVPLHDIGGGSRAARLAVELLRQGFHVTYVSVFGTNESVDLGLRFVHPQLEQYRIDEMGVANLDNRTSRPGIVLVEVPHPSLVDIVRRQREAGWTVVYDVIDRWDDPALGGEWYRPAVEQFFVSEADGVVASSGDLAKRVSAAGVDATLIPNAVDTEIFSRPPGPVPADFPHGDGAVLGYHGSLYGNWIDWPQIESVARSRPDARVVLIGDASRVSVDLPANVHLLGLKPQNRLPDYLARFDVGMIPFTVSETTHAVSPLKVYEYLACGIPVAGPRLRSLAGLTGVHTADRLVDAIDMALAGRRPDRARALRDHSWTERVGSLLAVAGYESPGVSGSRPLVVERPVVHHSRAERRL